MWQKIKKNYLLIIFIIIQTILYIIVGMNKQYLHLDEAYSFGLANYERMEIQENEDFYNNWHNKEYYEDYLAVQENEKWDYTAVYENQKNDVHPPLFYLILRIAMNFTNGHFTKWSGIVPNIIIYVFATIFMYLIIKQLLKDEKNANTKASILAFISSITLASLSNVVYIRMYALSALNILVTTYLHIKLLQSKKANPKLLICIGISALAGVLTHYYYLFYLATLYLIFFIKYIKQKRIKELIYYTLTMAVAGITSIIIFPHSIQHMFFGYRGQGVIGNLKNIGETISSIFTNIYTLNYYGFNNLMYIIIGIILVMLIYRKMRKKNTKVLNKEEKEIFTTIYIPTITFFIIAAIASPWNVLRYIVPVCGLIFVLVIYYLYKLLQQYSQKTSNIITFVVICITLVTPAICKMKPELLYTDRKEIVEKLGGELNLPTIYLYSTRGGNFLDDIILFAEINESYITKDMNYTQEKIEEIMQGKDISKGIIVFTNEIKSQEILQVVTKATKLKNIEQLKQLTACEVYYLF